MIDWLKCFGKKSERNIFILFFLVLLVIFFAAFMRRILLEQYLKLGNSIALRYSLEMAGELDLISTLLDHGSYMAAFETEKGADEKELSE